MAELGINWTAVLNPECGITMTTWTGWILWLLAFVTIMVLPLVPLIQAASEAL